MVPAVGPSTTHEAARSATLACVVAAIGLLYPIPGFVGLYNLAPGTACRPMGLAFAFLVGLVTPLVVLPLGTAATRQRGACRVFGTLAISLSLLPLPVCFVLFRWIVHIHALRLLP